MSHPKAVDATEGGAMDAEDAEMSSELENALQAMDAEVHDRCVAIRGVASLFAQTLRREIKTHLAKIPKKVKGLTLREFCAEFGEDVSADLVVTLREAYEGSVEREEKGEKNEKPGSRKRDAAGESIDRVLDGAGETMDMAEDAAADGGKRETDGQVAVEATRGNAAASPASKKQKIETETKQSAPPCTPVDRQIKRHGILVAKTPGTTRNPVRGEVVYSKNGSPLGAATDDDDSEDDEKENGKQNGRRESVIKRVTTTTGKHHGKGGLRFGDHHDCDTSDGLVFTTDDGKMIDVSKVTSDASGAEVEETVGMLAKMQQQVAAHMARLMAGRR